MRHCSSQPVRLTYALSPEGHDVAGERTCHHAASTTLEGLWGVHCCDWLSPHEGKALRSQQASGGSSHAVRDEQPIYPDRVRIAVANLSAKHRHQRCEGRRRLLLREQCTGLLGPEQRIHVGGANERGRQISVPDVVPGGTLIGACAHECLAQISFSCNQRAGNGR